MLFSVIVPTYNSERFLWECLESIVYQKEPKEIIVVDGGSTDRTLDIVNRTIRWSNEIHNWNVGWKVISERDKGEPDAINKGLRIAKGDIISFLDSDDVYEQRAFSQVRFGIGKAKWCYGKCQIINEDGEKIRGIVKSAKEVLQRRYSYKNLCRVDFLAQPSVFLTRDCVEEIGELDITDKLGFEYDWWLRIGAKYKPAYIDSYLANWRAHGENPSMKFYREQAKNALRLQMKYSHDERAIVQKAVYYGTVGLYWTMEKLSGSKTQSRKPEAVLE